MKTFTAALEPPTTKRLSKAKSLDDDDEQARARDRMDDNDDDTGSPVVDDGEAIAIAPHKFLTHDLNCDIRNSEF